MAQMITHAQTALSRGFHIFPVAPKGKIPLFGSNGHNDARSPSDPMALAPWKRDPNCNIGINLGASNLCVLDFDKPESVPPWLNLLRTYKVRTAKGIHIYFRGARPSTKLTINGQHVGEVKSIGGFVVAVGSIHPSGAAYTVLDPSPVAAMSAAVVALVNESSPVKQPINASPSGPPIPNGQHNDFLLRIARKLRAMGFDREQIEPLLVDRCAKRCIDYGNDHLDMCQRIAKSVQSCPPYDQRRSSPFPVRRNQCVRCHEEHEREQLKGHKIVHWRGVKDVKLCRVCRDELTAMNATFCEAKPRNGRMLDYQRWYVWFAFISLPKRRFLVLAIDEQQAYMRSLCDKALRLNLDALSFPREGEKHQVGKAGTAP
jgi:hypothetical protein